MLGKAHTKGAKFVVTGAQIAILMWNHFYIITDMLLRNILLLWSFLVRLLVQLSFICHFSDIIVFFHEE